MHGIDKQTQRPTRYRLSLYFLCKKPKSNGGGACLLSTKLPEEKKKKKENERITVNFCFFRKLKE